MDLFLSIGNYKTITEMLNTLDSFEYDFLLEKYRKMTFGPSMWNYMLAQIAWVQANSFSKKHISIESLMMGEIGELKATDADKVAVKMIKEDYFGWYIDQGYSKQAASELADKSAREYADNLRQTRIMEQMKEEQSQDLRNALDK
jgi:hypothetical protein